MTAEDWPSLFYGIGDTLASFERHFTGERADLPLIWGFFVGGLQNTSVRPKPGLKIL